MMATTGAWLLAPAGQDEGFVWLTWLVRLRWVAIFAQLVTLSFTFSLLDTPILLLPMGGGIAGLAIANVVAIRTLSTAEPVGAGHLLSQLLLDVGVLTVFFLLAGGPANPFTALYLVHIAMGAVMLAPRHAAVLTIAVVACHTLLFVGYLPVHLDRHSIPEETLRHLGHAVSFTITSTSVAVFVVGLASTLRRRKLQLLDARDRTARTDRLRSVGTLAAGAAHELNTPLSTIGLRLRRVGRRHQDDDTRKDVQAIGDQLQRCKRVVDQLLIGAGDPSASDIERRALAELCTEAVDLWSKGATLAVDVIDESTGAEVELPRIAFVQALINLLENAREAQEAADCFDRLQLRVLSESGQCIVELADRGCGLPEAADQVGEPFFTTKSTGTGLGVFVARAVADGVGGGLRYRPQVGGGTIARWWFPDPSHARAP